jgi:hypothetical protein
MECTACEFIGTLHSGVQCILCGGDQVTSLYPEVDIWELERLYAIMRCFWPQIKDDPTRLFELRERFNYVPNLSDPPSGIAQAIDAVLCHMATTSGEAWKY